MYGCSSNINITEIVSEIEKVAATATASPLLTLPIVRVCTTDFSRVPEDVISIVREMNVLADRVAATAASGDGASGRRQINICFSYSGQADIARAATLAVADIARAATLAVVTPTDIESRLLIQGGPFDLIIRTSGEQRISDFGIWHASRAELIFLKKLWPEIRPDDLDQCIQEFRARDRRLGK
jgi:undecaprenyl diphosphate synthase